MTKLTERDIVHFLIDREVKEIMQDYTETDKNNFIYDRLYNEIQERYSVNLTIKFSK